MYVVCFLSHSPLRQASLTALYFNVALLFFDALCLRSASQPVFCSERAISWHNNWWKRGRKVSDMTCVVTIWLNLCGGTNGQAQWARTARLTFYGTFLFGPCMTKWYEFLNRIKFATPTKALVYRVSFSIFYSYKTGLQILHSTWMLEVWRPILYGVYYPVFLVSSFPWTLFWLL